MERGSPRRIAYDVALLLLAVAVGEATRQKFIAAGGLLVGALVAAAFGITRARPTRGPRSRQDRTTAHPLLWAVIHLVTIGPALFYLTWDSVFDRRHLAVAIAASLAGAGGAMGSRSSCAAGIDRGHGA